MDREKIIDLLANPGKLNSRSAGYLRKLASRYPYCQPLRFLLAKNLQGDASGDFEEHVNQAAALSVDRRKFQNFMSGRQEGFSTSVTKQQTRLSEKKHPVVFGFFHFLSKKKGQPPIPAPTARPSSKPVAIVDYDDLIGLKKEPGAPVAYHATASKLPKRKHDHLIEKFINEDPRIGMPRKDLSSENLAEKPASGLGEFASETLAQIFERQGLFSKALIIYQNLSAKYPEKSSYFAEKISALKTHQL